MTKSQNNRTIAIYLILTLSTVAAYWTVRENDFISYDDHKYVTENQHVVNGVTGYGIIWAFTTGHAGNWHPLTWISHMLDCELFGTEPAWHHLTNLILHLANTLLLFEILRRLTGLQWPSAFVAGAFALHPMHVESVAWVAERKDMLSGLFWMLTIAAYLRYV
ncbi:MAG: tetratricopeptide repeat protein, partial [Planctomycetota bacterium]